MTAREACQARAETWANLQIAAGNRRGARWRQVEVRAHDIDGWPEGHTPTHPMAEPSAWVRRVLAKRLGANGGEGGTHG